VVVCEKKELSFGTEIRMSSAVKMIKEDRRYFKLRKR
jgi:hypothetical protein